MHVQISMVRCKLFQFLDKNFTKNRWIQSLIPHFRKQLVDSHSLIPHFINFSATHSHCLISHFFLSQSFLPLRYNRYSETSQFRRENIKTTHYDIQSVKFLEPTIWTMVPQNIKNCISLQEFKKLINVWKSKACPCRIG